MSSIENIIQIINTKNTDQIVDQTCVEVVETDASTKLTNLFSGCVILALLGDVSHGKSTAALALTGTVTQRSEDEIKHNASKKQGYANMLILSDEKEPCSYRSTNLEAYDRESKIVHQIGFADVPGHVAYCAEMLRTMSQVDGALLVVAANGQIQGNLQLIQHITAAKVNNLKIIACLNKIDLVSREELLRKKAELESLLAEIGVEVLIMIPTSFTQKIGVSNLLGAIMRFFNPSQYIERREGQSLFTCSRSFCGSLPGTNWNESLGGAIGGNVVSGGFAIGDEIEIRPGFMTEVHEIDPRDKKLKPTGRWINETGPIRTTIESLKIETTGLSTISPGSLVALGTDCDSHYTKNNGLVGCVVGKVCEVGSLPRVYNKLILDIEQLQIPGIALVPRMNEKLTLVCGTEVCTGIVKHISESTVTFQLSQEVCIMDNQRIILCQQNDSRASKAVSIVGKSTMSYACNPDPVYF